MAGERGQEPSLQREGFELVPHPSATIQNRLDELMAPPGLLTQSEALRSCWAETIPLIALSGAREVLPLHASTVRYSPALRNGKAMTPAGWPHVDYDTHESKCSQQELLSLTVPRSAPFSRYVMYQCCRFSARRRRIIRLRCATVARFRLTTSCPIEYHMKTPSATSPTNRNRARFSPRHDWWYFPDMTPQELLVFIGFDFWILGDEFSRRFTSR